MLRRFFTRRVGLALAAAALLLGLTPSPAADAQVLPKLRQAWVAVKVKVFNYSNWDVRLTSQGVRRDKAALKWEISQAAPKTKGAQTIIEKGFPLYKEGSYSDDALITLYLKKPVSNPACFRILIWGRTANPVIGGLALATDPPKNGCDDGSGGGTITWQESGDDVEIVIDREGRSW
jgi:hypothetical protein